MGLPDLWFILIAVLWTGYLVLKDSTSAWACCCPSWGRKDKDRRAIINTIGPVWDGNEVWLLTAGGATFAAFPEWYATLFSGFYLPLLLILLALIIRGVSFEYRGKIDTRWAAWCDWVASSSGRGSPRSSGASRSRTSCAASSLDASHTFTAAARNLLRPGGAGHAWPGSRNGAAVPRQLVLIDGDILRAPGSRPRSRRSPPPPGRQPTVVQELGCWSPPSACLSSFVAMTEVGICSPSQNASCLGK